MHILYRTNHTQTASHTYDKAVFNITNLALYVLLLVLVYGEAAVAAPTQLPEELSNLVALASQEQNLVEAARAYDKTQSSLADAELKEARGLGEEAARAKREQAAGRFERIRMAYEFVLERYPSQTRAKAFYGELLYDRFGEHDAAIKQWKESIILDPKLSIPYNDLGIHYCHVGEYAMGLQYYDKALQFEPENPDYLFNIVQTYLINYPEVQKIRKWKKAKVYREAMKLSEKAATLAPDDFDLARDYAMNFFAAENFDVKAKWKDAVAAWERARALARDDAERFNAWLFEGRACIAAGDKANARICLDEALKLQPESPVAKKLMEDLSSDKKPSMENPKKPGAQ